MTPHHTCIRAYAPADQPQIEWLYGRTPPAGQISVRPQVVPDDLRQIPDFYAHFLVATRPQAGTEAVVGMTGIEHVGSQEIQPLVPAHLDLPQLTARLRHVAVAPELWRHGIGRKLVEAAAEWFREHAYQSVILETTPQQEAAVSLYLALNFVEIADPQSASTS